MKRIIYFAIVILITVFLSSCSQSPENSKKPLPPNKSTSVNQMPANIITNLRESQQENYINTVSSNMNNYILKLEKLKTVDGEAVYFAGEKGEFYKLYEVFIKEGKDEDFLLMLNSQKPTVRIMGALCLAQKNKGKYTKQIQSLYGDNTLVDFFPGGCCGGPEKVGEIAKQIMKNPKLLDCGL